MKWSLDSWLSSCRKITHLDLVYNDILEYVRNGQEHSYGIAVKQIIEISRKSELKCDDDKAWGKKPRMLLWHGTKLAKVAPILEDGFKLPPQNNQMFGKGIYFADRVSKSCNYTDGTHSGSIAYLFLCDVLVGRVHKSKKPQNKLTKPPKGFFRNYESVMCKGKFIPDKLQYKKLEGCIIPCGPTICDPKYSSRILEYNEYIVYDTSKIRIKYLVKVEFTGTKI